MRVETRRVEAERGREAETKNQAKEGMGRRMGL